MAKFRSDEEKQRIIDRLNNSKADGVSKRDICRDEGVSPSLIYSWQKAIGKNPKVVTYQPEAKAKKQKRSSSRAMLFVGSISEIMEIAREF